ncbi:hypothetical protein [Oceanobacillus bengalensis]|uniref:Uncharacterized protein n=1 Tax=Oceanobacillus bengalensis TaxID=1435466 RepID=A0A494Z549_9BACI|nr:hypothetical protein [Oceanobacillus bengalensis]RKQ17631.1 hypothetical protein D8M05_04320 [Oceanobacillus bengalensis]
MKKSMKAFILTYLSILFFGSFLVLALLRTGFAVDWFPFIKKIEIFLYYFFAGAIGGSLRHLYMFCSHYMKNKLNDYREWVMYIFYPIFATGTAVVAVTLIQSGIFLIEFTEFDDAPYAQISIAFFVGFGFNRFLNRLNIVSKNLFNKNDTAKENNSEIK